jgi:hypothetical protein
VKDGQVAAHVIRIDGGDACQTGRHGTGRKTADLADQCERPEPARPLSAVGVPVDLDGFDAASVWQRCAQKSCVGGGAFPGQYAIPFPFLDCALDAHHAIHVEAVERIDVFGPFETREEALCVSTSEPFEETLSCYVRDRATGGNVGAGLDPAEHQCSGIDVIGEVGLEHDNGITLRIPRHADGLAQQHFERRGVTSPVGVAEQNERKDAAIRFEDLRTSVCRCVVAYQNLVITRQLRHHVAYLPEHYANGFFFVVRGNAVIDHRQRIRCSRLALRPFVRTWKRM